VIWLAVDLALALLAVLVLVLLGLGLWRRIKALKADVSVLSGLAEQASTAVSTIQR
jgi:hypothetical protein